MTMHNACTRNTRLLHTIAHETHGCTRREANRSRTTDDHKMARIAFAIKEVECRLFSIQASLHRVVLISKNLHLHCSTE